MPREFDAGGAVNKKFEDLISQMRSKRLSKYLPSADPKVGEAEQSDDKDSEQEALESMLDSHDDEDDQDGQTKKV